MIVTILTYILGYILIGYTLGIIIWVTTPIHWNYDEKILMIIFWPYMLYKLIEGFIKSFWE